MGGVCGGRQQHGTKKTCKKEERCLGQGGYCIKAGYDTVHKEEQGGGSDGREGMGRERYGGREQGERAVPRCRDKASAHKGDAHATRMWGVLGGSDANDRGQLGCGLGFYTSRPHASPDQARGPTQAACSRLPGQGPAQFGGGPAGGDAGCDAGCACSAAAAGCAAGGPAAVAGCAAGGPAAGCASS